VYLGGETGDSSIGSRWSNGTIQIFDSYEFKSTRYYDVVHHFKSLDTWLKGICRSWCSKHAWVNDEHCWMPRRHSIFSENAEEEEDDIQAPGMRELEESKCIDNKVAFIGNGNNNDLIKESLRVLGFSFLPKGYGFSTEFTMKWVQNTKDINFLKFRPGEQVVNHISNNKVFKQKDHILTDSSYDFLMLNPNLVLGNFKSVHFRTYMLIACTDPFLVLFNEGHATIFKEESETQALHKILQNIAQIKQFLVQDVKLEPTFVEFLLKRIKLLSLNHFMCVKDQIDIKLGTFELLAIDFVLNEQLQLYIKDIIINPKLFTEQPCLQELLPELVDTTIKIVWNIHENPDNTLTKLREKYVPTETTLNKFIILYNEATSYKFI